MTILEKYRSLIFDCDGVLLNSNPVKTEAFFTVALPYGQSAAQALVDYHVQNGGISRYRKFEYFLQEILGREASPEYLAPLLKAYAMAVRADLLTCAMASGLDVLRQATPDARWLVVSGGDQEELREVFAARGVDKLFNGGIFGSPDNKNFILERELRLNNITQPALFVGDSRYDHLAATAVGLDFMFLHGWSEFADWREYCAQHNVMFYEDIQSIL